jgi:hypothetical protein
MYSGIKLSPENSRALEDMARELEELAKIRGTFILPILMDETRSISHYFVSEVYDRLLNSSITAKNIDVIIHSAGGDADAAYHLATILQEICEGKLTMIVPRYAKSAATLLACGGDVVVMDLPSELGPIDPQLEDPVTGRYISGSSVRNTIKYIQELSGPLLKELCQRLPVIQIGDHESLVEHVEECLKELLCERMFKDETEKAKEIAEKLTTGYSYHGRAITLREAKKVGLKIETLPRDQWQKVWKVFRIFEKEVLVRG